MSDMATEHELTSKTEIELYEAYCKTSKIIHHWHHGDKRIEDVEDLAAQAYIAGCKDAAEGRE